MNDRTAGLELPNRVPACISPLSCYTSAHNTNFLLLKSFGRERAMKRFATLLCLLALTLIPVASAQPAPKKTSATKKAKPPCIKNFADCPEQGCGGQFDPNLNRLKNIRSKDVESRHRTLTFMNRLPDPENFTQGGDREELTGLGEGDIITVVAYLLVAKPEGGESCNCGHTEKENTDNHLVLVSKKTVDKFPISTTAKANAAIFHSRELESQTAEFTPRVRQDHPNFTREVVQPLINKTKQKALLVRVTGQQLFDSEHFIRHSLVRVNNWEVHPILKLEFCETGNTCKATSDAGWKSLDDLQ
jgi:hypothetical protein